MATEQVKLNEPWNAAPSRPLSGLTQMEQVSDDLMVRPWLRFGLPDWWRSGELISRRPAIEVSEDTHHVIVKVDIPGVKKEDLRVNLADNVLTICGERKEAPETEGTGSSYSERSYGSFCRSIQLPTAVKTDNVSAHFQDGVLDIRLPTTEQANQHEVTIKVD